MMTTEFTAGEIMCPPIFMLMPSAFTQLTLEVCPTTGHVKIVVHEVSYLQLSVVCRSNGTW